MFIYLPECFIYLFIVLLQVAPSPQTHTTNKYSRNKPPLTQSEPSILSDQSDLGRRFSLHSVPVLFTEDRKKLLLLLPSFTHKISSLFSTFLSPIFDLLLPLRGDGVEDRTDAGPLREVQSFVQSQGLRNLLYIALSA